MEINTTIKWGASNAVTKSYAFENEEQKAFFLKGVEEGCGWLEYKIEEDI